MLTSIQEACEQAHLAWETWRAASSKDRARTLRALAEDLDAHRAHLLEMCAQETSLFHEELTPEWARMVGTLRMFADVAEVGSWRTPSVDPALPPGAPGLVGPGHDVRRTLMPLGPVAVFGASNFPFAYGVLGGDTASALAAGCSVVVKEHPAHPRTGRLLAERARAVCERWSHPNLLSYVAHEDPANHAIAQALVSHPRIAAVGFTGSIPGGLAIDRIARARETPIPVFAEMGSINPVFITPRAMDAHPERLADQLSDSILMRVGQQCTRPGVIFVTDSTHSPAFLHRLAQRIKASPVRDMLAPWICEGFLSRMRAIKESKAASLEAGSDANPPRTTSRTVRAHLWCTTLDRWNATPVLREECFGPSVIVVVMPAWDAHTSAALSGNLTLSLFADTSDEKDLARARTFLHHHTAKAGRIIMNGVPTGVRVCASMVHGGPFPACNRPDTTAVGPAALARWCRPVCYQNTPPELLPSELQQSGATTKPRA
jgi:2,5-dioxopentanoate dehydrogenase